MSFKRCVVVGANGGLGKAFVNRLLQREGVDKIFALSRSGKSEIESDRLSAARLDFDAPETIAIAAERTFCGAI